VGQSAAGSRQYEAAGDQSPIPNPLLHGEAVSIGMVCAARLAERLGRVGADFTARLHSLLKTFGLPVDVPQFDRRQILDSIMHDKKVQHGRLSFVLPSRMGRVESVAVIAEKDICEALDDK
jgi:3-dehydroquinate synthetase